MMANHGVEIKQREGMTRLELTCDHQKGIIYVVPAEKSWVCSPELLCAHALAGFLGQLAETQIPEVKELMNHWGIYYRRLPLESSDGTS
jgi:hypothetical protein